MATADYNELRLATSIRGMGSYTTRLFAVPSFFSGAARVLDLGATFDEYNTSTTPAEADAAALRADFMAAAQDFRMALPTCSGRC